MTIDLDDVQWSQANQSVAWNQVTSQSTGGLGPGHKPIYQWLETRSQANLPVVWDQVTSQSIGGLAPGHTPIYRWLGTRSQANLPVAWDQITRQSTGGLGSGHQPITGGLGPGHKPIYRWLGTRSAVKLATSSCLASAASTLSLQNVILSSNHELQAFQTLMYVMSLLHGPSFQVYQNHWL